MSTEETVPAAPGPADGFDIPELIGGQNSTSSEDFAVRVDITFTDNTTERCSGTIIAPQLVLTAQHCLGRNSFLGNDSGVQRYYWGQEKHLLSVQVAFGANGDSTMSIAECALPGGTSASTWSASPYDSDLALLKLPNPTDLPFAFIDGVTNGEVPALTIGDGPGESPTSLRAAGWGRVSSTTRATMRQSRDISVWAKSSAATQIETWLGSFWSQLFAANPEQFAVESNALCVGDSGSPIYLSSRTFFATGHDGQIRQYTAGPWVIGVTSYIAAETCAHANSYGIVQRVRNHAALFHAPVWLPLSSF